MAAHRTIILDQEGDYVPVSYQFSDAAGAAADPTSATLIVYAADAGGSAWPTAGITGSPFTLAKIAAKAGWYGVRIAKTALPVGRYNFRVEATVDGVSAAGVERVDVLATGDFKADVAVLESRLTALRAGNLDLLDVAVSSRLADAEYTAPPSAASIASAVWAETTRTLSGFGTLAADVASAVWSAATRTLSAFGFTVATDAASREASKADVEALATASEISALQSHGDAAWATATGFSTHAPAEVVSALQAVADDFKADVSMLDATVSSRLAAADYVVTDLSGIEAVTAKMDTAMQADGLVWQFTASALELAPTGAGGTTLTVADIWTYADRGLTSAVVVDNPDDCKADVAFLDAPISTRMAADATIEATVDAASIHDALDTWVPAAVNRTPPVILPPEAADICRVYLWVGEPDGNAPASLDGASCKIVHLPYTAGGRFFSGQTIAPVYGDGVAYWDVVRGAEVLVVIPSHGVRNKIIIPDAETLDISTVIK